MPANQSLKTKDGRAWQLGEPIWSRAVSMEEGPECYDTSLGRYELLWLPDKFENRGTERWLCFRFPNGDFSRQGRVEDLFSSEAAAWAHYAGQLAAQKQVIDQQLTEVAEKLSGLEEAVR